MLKNKVQVISIGAELLSGACADTNTVEIQKTLLSLGFDVTRSVIVDDDQDEIAQEVGYAAKEADFVIVTGGLGPTEDDLTREGIAKAAGTELEIHEKALKDVEAFFKARNRTMTPSNRKQALIPKGGCVLPNQVGTAPSFYIRIHKALVFSLPGVPSEMRRLLREQAAPIMQSSVSHQLDPIIQSKTFLAGLPESYVNEKIKDILRSKDPRAGITVKDAVITLSLTSQGDGAKTRIQTTQEALKKIFGDHVFAWGDNNSLVEAVGEILIRKKISFALAESCTGGLVGHLFTQVPGISAVFLEGCVTYSGEAKQRTLHVPESTLIAHGEVSEQTAEAMARGVRNRASAQLGLSITGIAGPGGGTEEKPVGTVCMAVSYLDEVTTRKFCFTGDREQIKRVSANMAINLIRQVVIGADQTV